MRMHFLKFSTEKYVFIQSRSDESHTDALATSDFETQSQVIPPSSEPLKTTTAFTINSNLKVSIAAAVAIRYKHSYHALDIHSSKHR
jgi:hypothetical protein